MSAWGLRGEARRGERSLGPGRLRGEREGCGGCQRGSVAALGDSCELQRTSVGGSRVLLGGGSWVALSFPCCHTRGYPCSPPPQLPVVLLLLPLTVLLAAAARSKWAPKDSELRRESLKSPNQPQGMCLSMQELPEASGWGSCARVNEHHTLPLKK